MNPNLLINRKMKKELTFAADEMEMLSIVDTDSLLIDVNAAFGPDEDDDFDDEEGDEDFDDEDMFDDEDLEGLSDDLEGDFDDFDFDEDVEGELEEEEDFDDDDE